MGGCLGQTAAARPALCIRVRCDSAQHNSSIAPWVQSTSECCRQHMSPRHWWWPSKLLSEGLATLCTIHACTSFSVPPQIECHAGHALVLDCKIPWHDAATGQTSVSKAVMLVVSHKTPALQPKLQLQQHVQQLPKLRPQQQQTPLCAKSCLQMLLKGPWPAQQAPNLWLHACKTRRTRVLLRHALVP